MFIRLYVKIWDKHLRKIIHFDERQKGFVPVDGCFKNANIWQQIIKSQRKERRNTTLLLLTWQKLSAQSRTNQSPSA